MHEYFVVRSLCHVCGADTSDVAGSVYVHIVTALHRVSQELRSLLQDLIPELILSKKYHTHIGPICNGSGIRSF